MVSVSTRNHRNGWGIGSSNWRISLCRHSGTLALLALHVLSTGQAQLLKAYHAGRGDVFVQIAVEILVCGYLVFLAAPLVEPHPAPPALQKEILDLHRDRRSQPAKV